MKIIHCADIHLGSKIEACLPPEKVKMRRDEVCKTFKKIIDLAREEGSRLIILAGDVFDSDRPIKKDKDFFYAVVKNNPDIDFLYLRGNHDCNGAYAEKPENLKTFSADGWTTYSYGDVDVTGIEITAGNATSMYSSLKLDPNKKNIVVLHGQKGDLSGKDKVNFTKLKDKNIDYLALGHLHRYDRDKLDKRGFWAYSGCAEGRGFDEDGAKGAVVIDTEDFGNIQFKELCCRRVEIYRVDLTGVKDTHSAYLKVKNSIESRAEDIVRVVLDGELSFDGDGLLNRVRTLLSGDYFFVSIKDETCPALTVPDLEHDPSLRTEFVRVVLADESLSETDKKRVVALGLKALEGREVE